MAEFFNWVLTLAYFAVFLIGLVTCFKNAHEALLYRKYTFISIRNKRKHTLNAIANSTVAVLGIWGLIQAFIGV